MTHLELSLLALVIGLLGVGSGRMWGNKKVELVKREMEVVKQHFSSGLDKVRIEFRSIHERCHDACKAARIEKEHQLETDIKNLTIQVSSMLKSLEEKQNEVSKLLREQKRAMNNHFSQFDRLMGMLERDGIVLGKKRE